MGLDESGENTRVRRQSDGQQPHQPRAGEANDFAAKEARMRAASAARWAEDELFNLKNAFDLQLTRLEVKRSNKVVNRRVRACLSQIRENNQQRRTYRRMGGIQPFRHHRSILTSNNNCQTKRENIERVVP